MESRMILKMNIWKFIWQDIWYLIRMKNHRSQFSNVNLEKVVKVKKGIYPL
jgi:hypothetical protein